jgi:hypothetical protein
MCSALTFAVSLLAVLYRGTWLLMQLSDSLRPWRMCCFAAPVRFDAVTSKAPYSNLYYAVELPGVFKVISLTSYSPDQEKNGFGGDGEQYKWLQAELANVSAASIAGLQQPLCRSCGDREQTIYRSGSGTQPAWTCPWRSCTSSPSLLLHTRCLM